MQQALRAGASIEEVLRRDRDRPVVPRPDRAHQRGRRSASRRAETWTPTLMPRRQEPRLQRRPDRPAARLSARSRSRAMRYVLGRPPGLQDRRHLRGRVPGAHARTTTRATSDETEVRAERPAQGRHPRLAARTGSARASSSTTPACTPSFALSRRRLRDDHDQLQPGDRVDRLRHLATGCTSSRSRSRTCSRSSTRERERRTRRRHRATRRPDRARARQGPEGRGRPDPRHVAGGDRPGRGARRVLSASSTTPA